MSASPRVRVASTAELFEPEETACDACGDVLDTLSESEEDTHAPRGEGALLWFRDGVLREEKRPLCPSCAAAIGMTALSRWAIEEDEG